MRVKGKAEIRRAEGARKPKGSPDVYCEDGDFPNYVHYYVDRFKDLDQEARSRIVFHGIREDLGRPKHPGRRLRWA